MKTVTLASAASTSTMHYLAAFEDASARALELAENIEVVFYIHQVDEGRISCVSPAYDRMWQQPATAPYANGTAFLRDVHPEDPEAVEAAVNRQRAGESTDIRYRLALPGADIRYVYDRAFVTSRSDRHGLRVVGLAEDVTATTLARGQLAANARTFEALVRNSPFGIYVVDSDFCLLHLSRGAEQVAADIKLLIGRDFAEVMRVIWSEPYASEAIARFRHTLATGESFASDRTLEQRLDSDHREAYDWRIDQIELPDGTFGVVCYFYDLSERIAQEGRLHEALSDKDMLLREIDHRVRNSIAMVASLLSMQARVTVSVEVRQALDVASARLVAVARIHERLYKGKERGVVEFGEYLEEICSDLKNSIGNGEIGLDVNLASVDLAVDQAVPLGLAVNELVTNAFKHCGTTNAVITINLSADDSDLELIVCDNGVGMPKDYNPLKTSGLGTRVIRTLVRQLRGSLEFPMAGGPALFKIRVPKQPDGRPQNR